MCSECKNKDIIVKLCPHLDYCIQATYNLLQRVPATKDSESQAEAQQVPDPSHAHQPGRLRPPLDHRPSITAPRSLAPPRITAPRNSIAALLMAFENRWFGANSQNGLVAALQRAGMNGFKPRWAVLI